MAVNCIDVILPTRLKNLDWLKASIESVLKQDLLNKIIISLDTNDVNQIEKAKNLFNLPNVEFIYSDGKGVAAALNTALRHSEAEYVARQDDDDISLPSRFANQLEYLKSNNLDICFTSLDLLLPSGEIEKNLVHTSPQGDFWHPILTVGSGLNHASMLSKNFFKKENIFYPENIQAEDFALWLTIANKKKIGLLSNSLYLYRSHNNQVTKQWSWSLAYGEIFQFWKNFCEEINLPSFIINRETFNFIFNIEKTQAGYLGARALFFELLNQLNQFNAQDKLIYLKKLIIRISEIFDFETSMQISNSDHIPLNLDQEFQITLLSLLMNETASLKSRRDELGRVGHELQLIKKDLEGKLEQAEMSVFNKLKKYLLK